MEENKKNSSFDFLQDRFADWDAGNPSENVWENLEADLVTSKVWSKLENSLNESISTTYKSAYEDWEVELENDGWTKLNDSLSRERVWNRLSSTLSIPVALPTSYLKIAASFMIFMFTSLYISNSSFVNGSNFSANNKFESTNKSEVENFALQQSTTKDNPSFNSKNNVQNRLISNNQTNLYRANNTIDQKTKDLNQTIDLNNTTDAIVKVEEQTAIDPLFALALDHNANDIPDYEWKNYKRKPEPNWFVSAGSQMALLKEVKNGPLTSTVPRVGMIGEIGYSYNQRRFFVSPIVGFSQFTSEKGRYINGRYLTANQKLNVLQAKLQLGYSLNKIRFNVGVNANRIMSGYESQGTTISNVYDVPQIKLGYTAGLEVRLKTFKNNNQISALANYQYVPKLVSKNAEFERVEAVNFQLKYAF